MLVILMGWIYGLRRSDGLRCHVIHIMFHKDCFSSSEVKGGIQTHRQQGDIISLFNVRKEG
jgi:hypothetical protein